MATAGRVIAGRARGTRLLAPGPGTRPLSDRVKEALFAILEPGLPGAAVLDLCAGSGAGTIEALSRGAARAVLVERDPEAVRTIEANLRRTGLAGAEVRAVRGDALAALRAGGVAVGRGPFDLVLVDPPYDDPALLEAILARLGAPEAGALLAPHATVVAKHFWRHPPEARIGLLRSVRERRFGETTLTFYRREEP